MDERPKVLIQVKGGSVIEVRSTVPLDAYLQDLDNDSDGSIEPIDSEVDVLAPGQSALDMWLEKWDVPQE